ncbi:MAG: RES family NAD+ phosphorylase [Verrucomicrobiales bacterium]
MPLRAMANNQPIRPVRLPPADFAGQQLPQARQAARPWFRVHQTKHTAIYFSLTPIHRFSHPSCPHKMLYVAIDPATCLWERFGDQIFDNAHALPRTLWEDASISIIDVPALHLCDVSAMSGRNALAVDLTALMNNDLSVPQAWGLAIQNHPAETTAIKYKSRFSAAACLALFDRAEVAPKLIETYLGPLSTYDLALDWLARNKVALV